MSIVLVTDINKINISEWDRFVNSHQFGTVFQTNEMYVLFRDTKKFNPVIIAAYDNFKLVGVCLGCIIKEYSSKIGFFTSRTVVYGGPLIDDKAGNPPKVLDIILKELINEVKNKSVFIQFRNFFDWGELTKVFEQNGFKSLDRLNYLVDTTSENTVRRNISKSKLRQINKALRNGAEIINPENENQVKEFYNILHDLYKRKVKKPLPGYSFFRSFYLQSKESKLGVIKLIKYNNKIIGGILSPVFKNTTIYEWYVCGLDQEYKQCYPSVLATWAAIDYALKNNIKYFDFMGVGVPDKDYGVREFKGKFGGEQVSFGRFGRINNKFLYAITEIGYNILSGLKKI